MTTVDEAREALDGVWLHEWFGCQPTVGPCKVPDGLQDAVAKREAAIRAESAETLAALRRGVRELAKQVDGVLFSPELIPTTAVLALIEGVESPPMPVTREVGAPARGPSLGRTPVDTVADEPRLPVESQGSDGIARHSFDECDCVPGHRCDCWDVRAESAETLAALREAYDALLLYHRVSACRDRAGTWEAAAIAVRAYEAATPAEDER